MMSEKKKLKQKVKTKNSNGFLGVLPISSLVVLTILSLALVLLMIWGMYTSVKSQVNWDDDPVWLPQGAPWNWAWSNLKVVFEKFTVKVDRTNSSGQIVASGVPINVWEMLLYTLIYAGLGSLVMSMVTCIMGYLTAKFPNKCSAIITGIVITVMATPVVGSYTSELQILIKLGLYNTLYGAIIQKFNFLGMYFLVFQAFFKGLSNEYSEAAEIDGASEFTVLVRIMIPMVRNILFTVILLNFVGFWNDYQAPLLYFPSYPTLAYGLYNVTVGNDAYTTELAGQPMKLAASMIIFVPIIIVFVAFHDKLLSNVTMGGIKE